MYFMQFGLLATIAILVKAAPQFLTSDNYPKYLPYETSTPIEYQNPDPLPYFPISDDFISHDISSNVQQPGKINGVSFFLILESGSNYHGDEASSTDDEHKDFNVIVGFFNGINEVLRNDLETIARSIQSALESNANIKDGSLAALLRNSGLGEIKSLGEFKNSLQACQDKVPSKQG